jgi:hypothetical protein
MCELNYSIKTGMKFAIAAEKPYQGQKLHTSMWLKGHLDFM